MRMILAAKQSVAPHTVNVSVQSTSPYLVEVLFKCSSCEESPTLTRNGRKDKIFVSAACGERKSCDASSVTTWLRTNPSLVLQLPESMGNVDSEIFTSFCHVTFNYKNRLSLRNLGFYPRGTYASCFQQNTTVEEIIFWSKFTRRDSD